MKNQIVQLLSLKLGTYKKHNNNQYSYFCPNCSHYKPKLDISIDKGVYHCWICQDSGTIIKLLKRLGIDNDEITLLQTYYFKHKSIEHEKLNDDLMSLFNRSLTSNKVKVNQQNIQNKLIESTFYKLGYPLLSNSTALHKTRMLTYLSKRNVIQADIIKFNIHYSIDQDSLLIPSCDEYGKMNFFISKQINGKYINTNLVHKEKIIFNNIYIDWDEDIFIFEGFFDSLKLNENNIVVLLGSSISTESKIFQKLVQHNKKKYFCLDRDAIKKSLILIHKLINYNIQDIYIINWNNINNQINDFGDFKEKQNTNQLDWIKITSTNIDFLIMNEEIKK